MCNETAANVGFHATQTEFPERLSSNLKFRPLSSKYSQMGLWHFPHKMWSSSEDKRCSPPQHAAPQQCSLVLVVGTWGHSWFSIPTPWHCSSLCFAPYSSPRLVFEWTGGLRANIIFEWMPRNSYPHMYTYRTGLVRICWKCLSQWCFVAYLTVEKRTEVYIRSPE